MENNNKIFKFQNEIKKRQVIVLIMLFMIYLAPAGQGRTEGRM